MKMKRIAAGLLAAAMVTSSLAGCGGGDKPADTPAKPAQTGEANQGGSEKKDDVSFSLVATSTNTSTTFTFDPAVDYSLQKGVTMGIVESLFVLDLDKKVQPMLATSIEQTDDKTWVVTIRDGVKFSNGKDLTAEMVKKSLEYTISVNERIKALIDVESFEADGQKLTIHTNGIVATMPNSLTEVNSAIIDVEASPDMSKDIIGTGAYILESMDQDGNCTLTRNDNYWQGAPIAKTLTTKNIDAAAATLALQSGEIDWYHQIPTTDMPLFENNPEYQVLDYNASRAYYLYINPDFTFTKDDAVREALQYAFDREAIVAGVYGGYGYVADSMFADYSDFYDSSIHQVAYDQEKAKQILADAGYQDTDGDGFLEKDGEKVTLEIICYAKNQFDTLSEVIQAMLKPIGIDSKITVSDQIADDMNKGEFNIGTYGYNTLTLGDCYNYVYPVFHSKGTAHFCKLNDAEMDALLDELKETGDQAKRVELAKKIQEKAYASNDYIYLMFTKMCVVAKSDVENIHAMFGSDQVNNSTVWTFDRK